MKLIIRKKIVDLFKKHEKQSVKLMKTKDKKILTKKNVIIFSSVLFVITLFLIIVPFIVGNNEGKNSKWEPSDIVGFWGNISGISNNTESLNVGDSQNKEDASVAANDQDGNIAACKPGSKKVCDIDYLNGYEYLRGVNVPTLLRQRNSSLDYKDMGEPASSYDYLEQRGHKLIRLSIAWGDLQPNLDKAELDSNYLEAIYSEINKISSNNMYTVLTLHSGGTWPNSTGDSKGLSTAKKLGDGIDGAQSSRVWKLLSDKFRNDKRVIAYELFNEPWASGANSSKDHALIDPQVYRDHTNNIVKTIRNNNDTHTIWVGAMIFNGVDDIRKTAAWGTGKDTGPAWISDNLNRIIYTQHFYAPINDKPSAPAYDASYKDTNISRYNTVINHLTNFANWCQNRGVRCSLGEVGWPGRDGRFKINANNELIYDIDGDKDKDIVCGSYPQPLVDSAIKWNMNFGKKIYDIANSYKLDVTYFAAMSVSYPCEWGNWTAYVGNTFSNTFSKVDNWLAPGLTFGRSQNTIIQSPDYVSK